MSLTDDWKAEKLKNGWYFCLYENDAVFPALCFDDDFDDYELKVMEVLAPCDYEELQRLEKGWELYSHETVITKQLRQLLKECKQHMYFQKEIDNETIALLTRINAAIGESEE